MMELTDGNGKWDSTRLQSSVTNAIHDTQQILNLIITNKQEPNFLQNYLPTIDFETPVNNIGSVRDKRSILLVANFMHWLTKADEFWPLLDIQYRQNRNVTCRHKPNLQHAELLMQFFTQYIGKISKSQTQKPFHHWLTGWLQRNPISYKTNGDIQNHRSNFYLESQEENQDLSIIRKLPLSLSRFLQNQVEQSFKRKKLFIRH